MQYCTFGFVFVLGEATLHKTIEQRCDLIQEIPQIQIKSKVLLVNTSKNDKFQKIPEKKSNFEKIPLT